MCKQEADFGSLRRLHIFILAESSKDYYNGDRKYEFVVY